LRDDRRDLLRALFSLSNTTQVKEFARSLHQLGWEIISTKETTPLLKEIQIPCIDIESFVGISEDYGFPPTLHPKIESALTLEQTDKRIDLLFDIPYSLDQGNDVGGHTLLALAVKGNRIPIMSYTDMERCIGEFKVNGKVSDSLKAEFTNKTLVHIAAHYVKLLQQQDSFGEGIVSIKNLELSSGENPYQSPCHLFSDFGDNDPLSLHKFELLGKEAPCFTNLADLDSILQTLCLAHEAFKKEFRQSPFLAIASKHGNPCGFAIDWKDPAVALENALFGNPQAVWGGEFICNFPITDDLVNLLIDSSVRQEMLGTRNWMLDVVVAPSFSPYAVETLSQRKNRKIFRNKTLVDPMLPNQPWGLRWVRGGMIRQPPANYILDLKSSYWVGEDPSKEQIESLILAWATVWSSNLGGNEVALVKGRQLVGLGGGPSTIIAIRNAVCRAQEQGHSMESSVFAADAFFPFIDGPQVLLEAGCNLGLVPQGGKKEEEIKKIFSKNAISMCYVPKQFRGFCRH